MFGKIRSSDGVTTCHPQVAIFTFVADVTDHVITHLKLDTDSCNKKEEEMQTQSQRTVHGVSQETRGRVWARKIFALLNGEKDHFLKKIEMKLSFLQMNIYQLSMTKVTCNDDVRKKWTKTIIKIFCGYYSNWWNI